MPDISDRILILTARIVSAYLQAHAVDAGAVAALIHNVHLSLRELAPKDFATVPREVLPVRPRQASEPAVDVRKSVFPDHLVCLEDGATMTMLKRHLRSAHDLTPEQYRARWDLPENYPMVAPDYAKVRSRLAKASGLGRLNRR
jgi:predicted transcriptional regulator